MARVYILGGGAMKRTDNRKIGCLWVMAWASASGGITLTFNRYNRRWYIIIYPKGANNRHYLGLGKQQVREILGHWLKGERVL